MRLFGIALAIYAVICCVTPQPLLDATECFVMPVFMLGLILLVWRARLL